MERQIKGQRQPKKPTASQLERRLANAVVLVEKTKDTQSIFFSDKGLRLTYNEDYAVIETGYHRHVFSSITASGYSRPYIYTSRFVNIALDPANDCTEANGDGSKFYSYAKLMRVLKEKEDKTEYNIAWFCDIWFSNIFAPLYEIDETEASMFLVYERYMHYIARNSFLLDEHKEDVTNKQFVEKVLELEKSFLEGVEESVILQAKTDEQRVEEEVAAMQEQNLEQGT